MLPVRQVVRSVRSLFRRFCVPVPTARRCTRLRAAEPQSSRTAHVRPPGGHRAPPSAPAAIAPGARPQRPTATRSTCAPQATFTSADPKIATVDERGWVRPVANGQTQIDRRPSPGRRQPCRSRCSFRRGEPPNSFRHEVMPVLSQGRLQRGRLPRLLARQERLQALAARRRSGAGLRRHHPRRLPAGGVDLHVARRQPAGRQAARRRAARRGRALPHAAACPTRSSSSWIAQGAPGDLADPAEVVGVRLVPGQARAAARPEAPPAADRRLRRRHDARRDPPGHLRRQQRRSSPPSTTRAWSSAGDAGETAIVGPLRAHLRGHRA